MTALPAFLSGAIMALCLVAALFFARFWARTSERLFAVFAVSFLLLAIERCSLLVVGVSDETKSWVYLIRFVAFALLVGGIVDKNRSYLDKNRSGIHKRG